jgi:predicted nuclease of predicted toxin-antitoxin system
MKILIDMNLSPAWQDILSDAGHEAVHWSQVGPPDAKDQPLLEWARDRGYIVFTHDLDFGAILAASKAEGPSVLQVRAQDVSPAHLSDLVLSVLVQFHDYLTRGAVVSVDEKAARVRVLPLR